MKKVIFAISVIAATVFGVSSCQREQAVQDEPNPGKEVVISFTAERADLATKTAANEGETSVSYVWTKEDVNNIKLFSVETTDGKEKLSAIEISPEIISDGALLTITAKVEANKEYTFRAVLAGKWTTNGDKPRVLEAQSPAGTLNFDPNADVLISDDYNITVGEENTTEPMFLTFRRQIVVNKMTLKNLHKGEVVNKVIVTSDKNLTSYFETDKRSPANNGEKVITLNYTSGNVVPENGEFPVYFTSLPGEEQTLSVEVYTDQYSYSKKFLNTITFKLGQFTRFGVALFEGVANNVLTLPFIDDFSWQTGSVTTLPMDKYSESSTIYTDKGKETIRLGTSDASGYITTKEIDLSADFYVHITAAAFNNNDGATPVVIVDDREAIYPDNNSGTMTTAADDYYFNCPAATTKSKVIISVDGKTKRIVLSQLDIISGNYVLPPVINVTSDNLLEVANTASTQTITYTIENETEASLTATCEETWISNFVYTTPGQVTFEVEAQEKEADARSAKIILNYDGAKPQTVTVKQAAGEGAAATVTDKLTRANTYKGSETSYTDWTTEPFLSGATYAGNSYGGNKDAIQLRKSTGSNPSSGIVTTESGGIVKKIVVKWNTSTQEGRTLDIYGKNSAYEAVADLYDNNKQGKKIGSITYGTETAVINDAYEYIGLCSNNGAMYLEEIAIEWEPNGSTTPGTGEGGDGGDTTDPEPDTANIVLDFANLGEQASRGLTSYTEKWEMNTPNGDWIITNFNNNNLDWTYIRCGSKNNESEAKIDTKQSLSGSYKKVIVTIDNVSAQYVNYSKLIVASDSDFSKDRQESVVDLSKGDISFPVSNPVPNAYYSLVFNMQKSSNGTLQISKVVYSVE